MAWKALPFFLDRSVTGYETSVISPSFDVEGFSRIQLGTNVSYLSGVNTSLWINLDTSMDAMNWLTIHADEVLPVDVPELQAIAGGKLLRFLRVRIYMDQDSADPGKPQTAVLSVQGMATN